MKAGVLLSGSGVFDGSEVRETTLLLLALSQQGIEAVCAAPDIEQHHVINHINGEEMHEKRNVLVESARIARGDIIALDDFNIETVDALIMPGGFGAAKNFSKWAFQGPEGEIHPPVKELLIKAVERGTPVLAMCITPVVLAKALSESGRKARLTLGTAAEDSDYDIQGFHSQIESLGMQSEECSVKEIVVDEENKVISTPCYMQNAELKDMWQGISAAVEKLKSMI